MKLLIMPVALAFVATVFWMLLWLNGFEIVSNKADEGLMSSGTIAFLFFIYGLLAVFVMAKVWGEWCDMETAVRKGDEEKFLDLKDRRVPRTLKMLLVVFSLFIVAAFFVSGFESAVKGAFSIFAVVFMLTAVWNVLMDLDDYFTGEWNVEISSLPTEWQSKHFKTGGRE
jgi:hypothetical protein